MDRLGQVGIVREDDGHVKTPAKGIQQQMGGPVDVQTFFLGPDHFDRALEDRQLRLRVHDDKPRLAHRHYERLAQAVQSEVARLEVLETRDDWLRVRLDDGPEGWVAESVTSATAP